MGRLGTLLASALIALSVLMAIQAAVRRSAQALDALHNEVNRERSILEQLLER